MKPNTMNAEHEGWAIEAEEHQVQVRSKGWRGVAPMHYVTTVRASREGSSSVAFTILGTEEQAVELMRAELTRRASSPVISTKSAAKPAGYTWRKGERSQVPLTATQWKAASAAYSADKVANGHERPGTVRRPVNINGSLYITTSATSATLDGWELVPEALYQGRARSYADTCQENPRRYSWPKGSIVATVEEPPEFYEGVRVKKGQQVYCLTRPVVFVERATVQVSIQAEAQEESKEADEEKEKEEREGRARQSQEAPRPDPLAVEFTTRARPEHRARRVSTSQVHRILHPRQCAIIAFDPLPWQESPVRRFRAA